MKRLITFFLLLPLLCFAYDFQQITLSGKNARTMICFHGYGGSNKIVYAVKSVGVQATLIGFNTPDHDILYGANNASQASWGTINELLPGLTILKQYVIDQDNEAVDLYGFSAGGGSIINTIAVLNSSLYDSELKKIGIESKEKQKILKAIQNGIILLDAPLKSMQEILELRGPSPELQIVSKQYLENHLNPIDTIQFLNGLSLNIILFFQNPDAAVQNRDDALYIERLKKANSLGSTSVIIANEGGHLGLHLSLWKVYRQKI